MSKSTLLLRQLSSGTKVLWTTWDTIGCVSNVACRFYPKLCSKYRMCKDFADAIQDCAVNELVPLCHAPRSDRMDLTLQESRLSTLAM